MKGSGKVPDGSMIVLEGSGKVVVDSGKVLKVPKSSGKVP